MAKNELKKAAAELEAQVRGTDRGAGENILSKALANLSEVARILSKGHVDLAAKDWRSSNLDDMDNAPRRRKSRQKGDNGNGFSFMEPSDEEEDDFDREDHHKTIVTGSDSVHGDIADAEGWEDAGSAYVGDRGRYAEDEVRRSMKGRDEEDEKDSDDDDEKDEEDNEKSFGKSEAKIYDQLLSSQDFAEVVEGSPAVEHMANVFGKSFGNLNDEIEDIRGALITIIQGQAAMIKSLQGQPATREMPGVFASVDGKAVTQGHRGQPLPQGLARIVTPPAELVNKGYGKPNQMMVASSEMRRWHADTFTTLQEMAKSGAITEDLFGKVASSLDTQGPSALKMLPAAARKQYGLEIEN